MDTIICGEALQELKKLPDSIVQCCVTSPPYWGLRDYGVEEQLGLETSPEEYTARLVEILREVKRLLKDGGTLWLNIGDCYGGLRGNTSPAPDNKNPHVEADTPPKARGETSRKQLLGIPWRVAFALQSEGWCLRSDIIWHKNNCMPESVTDRPTSSHEHIFLLVQSDKYYYNADAIREPHETNIPVVVKQTKGHGDVRPEDEKDPWGSMGYHPLGRNKRDVWSIPTQPFPEARFAVFPERLIEPCVLAGSKEGDIVLDPFMGSGTVVFVAIKHKRKYLGIDINSEYCELARKRTKEVRVALF